MKDGSIAHREAEHFLQAERLRAELHLVVVEAALRACFIFDGPRRGDAPRPLEFNICSETAGRHSANLRFVEVHPADFHEVSFAGEPERIGEERKRAEQLPAGALLVARRVDVRVGEIAEEGVLVGAAETLDEFQRGATLAVEVVVEGGERERVHGISKKAHRAVWIRFMGRPSRRRIGRKISRLHERLDPVGHFAASSLIPAMGEFGLVQVGPFLNESQHAAGQAPCDPGLVSDGNLRAEVAVFGMKMRRQVVVVVKSDDDAEEAADLRPGWKAA